MSDKKKYIDHKTFLYGDNFAKNTGVRLIKVEEGYALAELEIKEEHMNDAGVVQGGAIFTLADYAFAAASNSYGQLALGISANISFLKAVRNGILKAEAKEISRSRKIASYGVRIFDESNKTVADFKGIVYIKS